MMVRCVFWQFLKDAKHDVPEHLNYGRLLKELQKEIRAFDRDLRASDGEIHSVSYQISAFDRDLKALDGEIHSVSCQSSMAITFIDQERL